MGKRIGFLNLVNYKDHPTNDIYKVLNYNSQEEADLFEKKLIEGNFFFEKDVETYKEKPLYLFAVKNRQFEAVQKLNFEVVGEFRKPMIKSKIIRYGLVLFFLIIMSIALIGYFISTPN